MNKSVQALFAVLLATFAGLAVAQSADWEPAIKAFEEKDAAAPPAKNGILFVGSSSIRFWNTDEDFPDLHVINRGFGGSQTADVVKYMDRIVLPYEPRLIVFYAGDNDIAQGKTPEDVIKDTESFFNRVHEALPDSKIVYIAIKPSIARWNLIEPMRKVNAHVRNLADSTDYLDFVDVDTPMLNADGKPREELFIDDGLHLNRAGYDLWCDLVRPYLVTPSE